LRAEGFATLSSLEPVADNLAEARRLGCTHVLPEADGQLPPQPL
jgi:hypothetical protein